MERYVKPISLLITVNDTVSLPIRNSVYAEDGGRAKPNTIFEDDSLTIEHKDLWD